MFCDTPLPVVGVRVSQSGNGAKITADCAGFRFYGLIVKIRRGEGGGRERRHRYIDFCVARDD